LHRENGDPGSADAAQVGETPDETCPAAGDGGDQQAEDGFGGLGAVAEWLRSNDCAGTAAQEPSAAEDDGSAEEPNLVDALTKHLGFT
jgi:hypothetical protein